MIDGVTLVSVVFSLSGFIQSIIGVLIGKKIGLLPGMLAGGIIALGLLDILWVLIEGGHIPLVLLIAAMVFIVLQSIMSKNELTQPSKWMMTAEIKEDFL